MTEEENGQGIPVEQHGSVSPDVPIESERFDSYDTPARGVRLRTERDTPPRILQSKSTPVLFSLIEKARTLARLYRQRKTLLAEEGFLRDELRIVASGRADFRGLELLEEGVIINVVPTYSVDGEKLQQALGNENFTAVVDRDTLHFEVNIKGHPEARHIIEQAMRRSVRAAMRLANDQEVDGRLTTVRTTSVKLPLLKHLMQLTGIKLPKGTVTPPHMQVRIHNIIPPSTVS